MTATNLAENTFTLSPQGSYDLSIVDSTFRGILHTSPDGVIYAANYEALKMLGYTSIDELKNINFSDVYLNSSNRQCIVDLVVSAGECSNIELELKKKDGQILTVVESAHVVRDSEGSVLYIEEFFDDITTKKAFEDLTNQYITALQASEKSLRELHAQKDKMYSIISHDLRSPFASIIGFCDLLLTNYKQIPDEERKEYISCIKQSAHTQLTFVNDLIDFTKLDTRQVKLQMSQVDLYIVVRNVIDSFMGLARKKKIAIISNLPLSLVIRADERWIQQLFSNLIENALKFTKQNGTVTISMTSQTEKGCSISVSDTGVGIHPELLTKLFKIDDKFSTTGTSGEQGNGLGLPLCHEIMKNHGGKISAESTINSGTTFHLSFPEVTMRQHLKVLIVDDDPIVRLVHSNYVEQIFPMSQSIHAVDGVDALKQVEQTMPQLILTDYAMPNMNGYELIKSLKNNLKTSDIPIIVVTGHMSQANKEALLLSGARAVITKPLLHDELEEITKKILAD